MRMGGGIKVGGWLPFRAVGSTWAAQMEACAMRNHVLTCFG
jgi:hypothetical protein